MSRPSLKNVSSTFSLLFVGVSFCSKRMLFNYAILFPLSRRFGIVRQQAHYSIDVFTSLYLVPMVWIVVHYFFPNDPVPPTKGRILKELGSVGSDDESPAGTV